MTAPAPLRAFEAGWLPACAWGPSRRTVRPSSRVEKRPPARPGSGESAWLALSPGRPRRRKPSGFPTPRATRRADRSGTAVLGASPPARHSAPLCRGARAPAPLPSRPRILPLGSPEAAGRVPAGAGRRGLRGVPPSLCAPAASHRPGPRQYGCRDGRVSPRIFGLQKAAFLPRVRGSRPGTALWLAGRVKESGPAPHRGAGPHGFALLWWRSAVDSG